MATIVKDRKTKVVFDKAQNSKASSQVNAGKLDSSSKASGIMRDDSSKTPTADAAQAWLNQQSKNSSLCQGGAWDNPTFEYTKSTIWFLQKNKGETLNINDQSYDRAEVISWIKKVASSDFRIANYLIKNDKLQFGDGEEFLDDVLEAIGLADIKEASKSLDNKALEVFAQRYSDFENSQKSQISDDSPLAVTNTSNIEHLLAVANYDAQNVAPLKDGVYKIATSDPHFDTKGIEPIVKSVIDEATEKYTAIVSRSVANGHKLTDAELDKLLDSFSHSKAASLLPPQAISKFMSQIRVLANNEESGDYYKARVKLTTSFEQIVEVYEKTYGLSASDALMAASEAELAISKGSDAASAYIEGFSSVGIDSKQASAIVYEKENFESYQENLQLLANVNNYGDGIFVDGKELVLEGLTINEEVVSISDFHRDLNQIQIQNNESLIKRSDVYRMVLNNTDGLDQKKAERLGALREEFINYKGGKYKEYFSKEKVSFKNSEQVISWARQNKVLYCLGETRPSFGNRIGSTMQNWSIQSGLKGGIGKAVSGIAKGLGFKMPELDIKEKLLKKFAGEKLASLIPGVGLVLFLKNNWKKLAIAAGFGLGGILAAFLKKGIIVGSSALGFGTGGAIWGAKIGASIGTAILPGVGTVIGGIIGGVVGFVVGVGVGILVGLGIDKLIGVIKASTAASGLASSTSSAVINSTNTTTAILGEATGGAAAAAQVAVYGALGAAAVGSYFFIATLNSAFSLPPFDKYDEYINQFGGEYDCPENIPEGFPDIQPVIGNISQYPNGNFSHKGVNAIDIGENDGAEIKAGHDGEVIEVVFSRLRTGYGNHVRIVGKTTDSSGIERAYTTIYAHMNDDIRVVVGQSVTKGVTVIGTVDSTGNSKGAHLHYEIQTFDVILKPIAINCLWE